MLLGMQSAKTSKRWKQNRNSIKSATKEVNLLRSLMICCECLTVASIPYRSRFLQMKSLTNELSSQRCAQCASLVLGVFVVDSKILFELIVIASKQT